LVRAAEKTIFEDGHIRSTWRALVKVKPPTKNKTGSKPNDGLTQKPTWNAWFSGWETLTYD